MLQYIIAGLAGLSTIPKVIDWHNKAKLLNNNTFKIIGTENSLFYIDDMIRTIVDVDREYEYYDIRPTDIVMDLGACIGGFALKISQKVNHVYAVEPILVESLNQNIQLNNNVNNITILNYSLDKVDRQWNGERYKNSDKTSNNKTLSELIDLAGGHIDFLKLDCEGGEWCIQPDELIYIRRIEAEIHSYDSNNNIHNMTDFENTLQIANFEYTKQITSSKTMLVHAKNKMIT